MRPDHDFIKKLYGYVIEPRTIDKDSRRQELILNILLAGLSAIAVVAITAAVITYLSNHGRLGLTPFFVTFPFLVILLLCRWAIWKGYIRAVSYGLLLVLFLNTVSLAFQWGFALPQVILSCVMIVVMAGILLGARVGLYVTGGIVGLMILAGIAQINGWFKPDLAWQHNPLLIVDAIGYALVLAIIGLVSWLSTREIDRSLRRARQSEADLLAERDGLELKVAERTRELEHVQMLRITELERFAAFGKVNATLVHDMSNPLMAATLDLQQLEADDKERLSHVSNNLSEAGRRLESARRQLGGGGEPERFEIGREIRQAIQGVRLAARDRKVRIEVSSAGRLRLYGDPVKFGQIVSNLIMNALEAYTPDIPAVRRVVTVSVKPLKHGLRLTIRDRGCGIDRMDIEHIFDPFFSKKPDSQGQANMGIGLGIVKRYSEEDFRGAVTVSSSPQAGTRFSVTLRQAAGYDQS